MAFLRNVWYIAAWQNEIADGVLFDRKILNEPVLFYREQSGRLVAIGDRCPHRFAPLHLGKLEDDCVQCPYHGLTFDGSGRCVHNPHGDGAIPKAAKTKSYPVVERDLAVWIWMGEPALADASRIPDMRFLSAARETARGTGYLHVRANYVLLSDNIMDLGHVDFLHPTTLGGGAVSQSTPRVSEVADKVRITWEAKGVTAPPTFAAQLPDPAAPADIQHEVVWSAAAFMQLEVRVTPSGAQFNDGIHITALHEMTPETAATTHYFFAHTNPYGPDDAEIAETRRRRILNVFETEDKPMVEAQQDMMGTVDLWSLRPILLPSDAGAIRARRFLDRMIEKECAESSPVSAAATP